MGTGQVPSALNLDEAKRQILERYDQLIEYYWKTSRSNKRAYKATRYLLIVLGALVTLVSSLSSANFIKGTFSLSLAILTPLLAATLAIVGGVSQAFQWGAAWSDTVITATRLGRQRDRIAVTPSSQLDPVKEMDLLDGMVVAETEGFFQRLFGSGGPSKSGPSTTGD